MFTPVEPLPLAAAVLPQIRIAEVDYSPGLKQPKHSHARTSVSLVIQGALEERVGSRTEVAAPLSVVIKPAGTEHADHVGPHGARTLQLVLADDLLEDDAPGATLSEWRWLHAGHAAQSFLEILAAVREHPHDASVIEGTVYHFLGSLSGNEPAELGPAPPAWLKRVVDEVDDTFAEGPRVRALALGAGVHPVSLARCFRRYVGMSVTGRIRRRRVQAAVVLLSGSKTALSSVAHSAGFCDQSHLCRVFKAATGVTPLRFRTLSAT